MLTNNNKHKYYNDCDWKSNLLKHKAAVKIMSIDGLIQNYHSKIILQSHWYNTQNIIVTIANYLHLTKDGVRSCLT